jgi:hypothetical protein
MPAAQLIIGPREHTNLVIKQHLMQLLCTHNGCAVCASCRAIADEQHHAVTWIHPKGTYTLEDLDAVFATLSFALEHDQHHFFVLCKADFLTHQCSNRLLKSLEEPPYNYHFILLAERSEHILSTVRSRCITSTHITAITAPTHERFAHLFMGTTPINPALFHKELDQAKINEQETQELLDYLLRHWIKKTTEALDNEHVHQYAHAQQMVRIITNGLLHAPMPGSSTLFWKNLMLEVQQLQRKKIH